MEEKGQRIENIRILEKSIELLKEEKSTAIEKGDYNYPFFDNIKLQKKLNKNLEKIKNQQ